MCEEACDIGLGATERSHALATHSFLADHMWDPEQATGGSLLGSWGWKAQRDRNTRTVWVLGGSPKISAVGCVT